MAEWMIFVLPPVLVVVVLGVLVCVIAYAATKEPPHD